MSSVVDRKACCSPGSRRAVCTSEIPSAPVALSDSAEHEPSRKLLGQLPGGKAVPQRQDGMAAYLASDDSGFVTAATFRIDGGIRCAVTVPVWPRPTGLRWHVLAAPR